MEGTEGRLYGQLEPTYSAYWVGLGGGGQQSTALEQIGTQGDCSASGTPRITRGMSSCHRRR